MSAKRCGLYEEPFLLVEDWDETSDGGKVPDNHILTAKGDILMDGEPHVQRRIVACVNAMEDIEDPEAFVKYARQASAAQEAHVAEVRRIKVGNAQDIDKLVNKWNAERQARKEVETENVNLKRAYEEVKDLAVRCGQDYDRLREAFENLVDVVQNEALHAPKCGCDLCETFRFSQDFLKKGPASTHPKAETETQRLWNTVEKLYRHMRNMEMRLRSLGAEPGTLMLTEEEAAYAQGPSRPTNIEARLNALEYGIDD